MEIIVRSLLIFRPKMIFMYSSKIAQMCNHYI